MSRTAKVLSLVAVIALAMLPALAGAADAPKAKMAAHPAVDKPVVWPADQLKWVDAAGAPPGVKMAVLWGDPTKGAYGMLQRFPAGFKAPMHTHSSDLRCVVLSGTLIHGEMGGKETKLPPGSYLVTPRTEHHTTECAAGADCVVFIHATGKFDVVMDK